MTNWLATQIFARIEALERAQSMKTKKPPTPKYLAVLFRDRKGEWRWSIITRNKKIVATGGEGYKRRGHCERTLRRVLAAGPTIPIEVF